MKKILCFIFILLIPISVSAQSTFLYELCSFERVSGSRNEAKAAKMIENEFKQIGYNTQKQDFSVWYTKKIINSSNVIASKPSANKDVLIIGAHYDSVKGSKGAIDNGASVSALIDIAKEVMNNDYEFEIRFVAFGSEEVGYLGSKEYVKSLAEKENIIGYINLDMIGYNDLKIGTVTGETNKITDIITKISDIKSINKEARSDHAIFENFLSVPSMTFYCDNNLYHTDKDILDNVNFETIEKTKQIIIKTINALNEGVLFI